MRVNRPSRRKRLIAACAGDREQVRGVEGLTAHAIASGGGLLLGRWRMPA
jgi:hypothetical protein